MKAILIDRLILPHRLPPFWEDSLTFHLRYNIFFLTEIGRGGKTNTLKTKVEILMNIRRKAIESVVKVYDNRLSEIDEEIKRSKTEIAEHEEKKHDLEIALDLARKHLQEAENLPSRKKSNTSQQVLDQDTTGGGEKGVEDDGSQETGQDGVGGSTPPSAQMAPQAEEEELSVDDGAGGEAVEEEQKEVMVSASEGESPSEESSSPEKSGSILFGGPGLSKPAKPSSRSKDKTSAASPPPKPETTQEPGSVSRGQSTGGKPSADKGNTDGLSRLSNKVASTLKKNLILGEATVNRLIPKGKTKKGGKR